MTLERQLQEALRARDPGEDFTRAVLARVAAAGKAAPPARTRGSLAWWPSALAASLLATGVGLQALHVQLQQQRARTAGMQLAMALEITSYDLNQVQRRLDRPEPDQKENGT